MLRFLQQPIAGVQRVVFHHHKLRWRVYRSSTGRTPPPMRTPRGAEKRTETQHFFNMFLRTPCVMVCNVTVLTDLLCLSCSVSTFLPPWQRLSYYTLIGAFLISTMSYVLSGGDGQVAWGGMLLLSLVAFERVSDWCKVSSSPCLKTNILSLFCLIIHWAHPSNLWQL